MQKLSAALALLSGCSWIAMEHLPSDYDGKTEPYCSTGQGTVAVDGVLAALNLIGAGIAASTPNDPNSSSVLVGSLLDAAVWGASAVTGINWASACRHAKDDWGNVEQAQEAQQVQQAVFQEHQAEIERQRETAAARQNVEQQVRLQQRQQPVPVQAPVMPGRPALDGSDSVTGHGDAVQQEAANDAPAAHHWYCIGTDAKGIGGWCYRDDASCEDDRAKWLTVNPNVDTCDPLGTAWCFSYAEAGKSHELCWVDQQTCSTHEKDVASRRGAGILASCAEKDSPTTK